MKLPEAIEVLKKWGSLYDGTSELLTWDMNVFNEAIDTVVNEICDHNFLPIGEWDGVMMLQCTKCNLYKEGEGKKTCVHPYAFVYGGCGKPERCLKCGEILSD